MLTDKEKLTLLINQIKAAVPYITATLGPDCTIDIERLKHCNDIHNWMAVHKGRASSSIMQLKAILAYAEVLQDAE